jgi:catechol 2,3-dioxygenase-like lactoylglutathione lyase family enzyme
MPGWYNRAVVAVADFQRAVDFYLGQFGFREDWRHEEDGVRIVQVSRDGCELILSDQWPERAGTARFFVSLDWPDFKTMRAETTAKGIAREGRWGYRMIVVADPDGNELWFPWPGEEEPEA